MKRLYIYLITGVALATGILVWNFTKSPSHRASLTVSSEAEEEEEEDEGPDGYDGPAARDRLEFEQMKDPALGYVPYTRLTDAIEYTNNLKHPVSANTRLNSTLLWEERGPIYDSVGPSNGNSRGGNLYTSGRIAAVLIDTLNDPSGNTVIVGGVSGGVWKCTNFLAPIANWKYVNDYFDNMAISSLCQDPFNPSVMYFSTGEATSNADAHFGQGIWKSTDKGNTWTRLPSTLNFIRNFKVLCDATGNVYLAARTTTTPAVQPNGLMRSSDGGTTWVNITPANLTSNVICTDIEISTTGKLHASFGYASGGGIIVNHRYTTNPATVTTATGWNISTGIKQTATCVRLELACLADTLYGVTVNTAANADSCYKSIDGGATWVKQNATVMPTGVLSGQGWYNETLAINPSNSNEVICGGLDAYKSVNSGSTWTRLTYWVTTIPYVHADHHFMQWWNKGSESRIVIGCDGGIFYSNDAGNNWLDKNRNLGLKQFYACAIHPAAGSPYLIAGAQDNGCHQLKNPGLSYSTEITGGDGMYVYINQLDPSVQFGSYVYNQYRRSTNGGQTWSAVNLNTTVGLFANPFDYDDGQNIMYACYSANNILRWPNANTGTTANILPITALSGGQAAALKMSPYTANRLYLGGTTGRVLKVESANVTPVVTDITGATFPAGSIHCVNVGSSDNFLVATFSNYGVNNVWYSTNGGTSWSAVDGNLPDMPVWWALFDPYNDNKLILGTETGVWTTDLVNGNSTVWAPNPGFPTTRVSMLRMRTSDKTVVAAGYGRGLFTAVIPPPTPQISFVTSSTNVTEQTDAVSGCRNYKDYLVNVGIVNAPIGDATVTYTVQAGNTATRAVDFDFTTNGSFATPSNQHVFVTGATGPDALKQITIRVYDDAEVESTESFTIGFAISGTTNATAGTVQTHTMTIGDNDRYPVAYTSANYTIGTYNNDLTSLNTPFEGTRLKHKLQVLYRASELNAAGISVAATLSSMKIRVKTKNTTQPFKGFTVSLANTSAVNLGAGFVVSVPFTQVYSGNYSTMVGDNTFNFSTPFNWDGTSNVVVQFCYDNSPGTPEGVTDVVEGMAAPFGVGVRACTYSNFTTSTLAGCNLLAGFVDDNRLNATFATTFGDSVATALNSTKTEYLGANNDLFYYTPKGEIMARILNLSALDYGCTQVIIDRAGTGVSQFWNTNPANYLMNKTFRIIPTTNNPTGKYEATFYFTKAEKDGWEAATGQTFDKIQLVKLPSRISNVTPLITQPDGPGTVQVVDPVRRTFGPVFYTVSFLLENGFSGYGFGVPGRMNTILTLSGKVNANNADIDLSWTTSVEINSTYFELEKSYDGVTFHKIATVQASFNRLTQSIYQFTDHENVEINYYRVRMFHTDTVVLLSNTILIRNDKAPQHMFVLTNPFTNEIRIRFARPPQGPIVFSLFDAAGRLIERYNTLAGTSNLVFYNLNAHNVLSRGVYILDAYVDKKHYGARLLRQ